MMETASAETRKPYLVLRPAKGWAALNLGELWHFRDLLFTLAGRDVKLRYRQTALGVTWVILQPLLLSGILTLVFGVLSNMPTGNIPPFLFSFAGLLGYAAFNSTVTKGSMSLIGNSQLVSKVYFPRLAIPLSTVLATLLDFCVSFVVVLVLMAIYRVIPNARIFLMPVFLLMFLAIGTGIGLLAAALTVSYRDVQYIIPVVVGALQLLSPIGFAYPDSPKALKWLPWYMILDPLAPVVEAFRWSVLGQGKVHWPYVGYSAVFSIVVLFVGIVMFKRMEREFADVI
jgi:lipopolysaccharide transport system permease protein